jgi:hypothetical protein
MNKIDPQKFTKATAGHALLLYDKAVKYENTMKQAP